MANRFLTNTAVENQNSPHRRTVNAIKGGTGISRIETRRYPSSVVLHARESDLCTDHDYAGCEQPCVLGQSRFQKMRTTRTANRAFASGSLGPRRFTAFLSLLSSESRRRRHHRFRFHDRRNLNRFRPNTKSNLLSMVGRLLAHDSGFPLIRSSSLWLFACGIAVHLPSPSNRHAW